MAREIRQKRTRVRSDRGGRFTRISALPVKAVMPAFWGRATVFTILSYACGKVKQRGKEDPGKKHLEGLRGKAFAG